MTDQESSSRDWLKIVAAVLAIIVTVGLSFLSVLTELQKTTVRHDAEHIGFRDDILELRSMCRTDCRK
jgi:hypothetical protein